jgi:CDP-4-dehydro-6-deoxyglucose reductase
MSFRITVHPSGHEFAAEEGESILDAALNHGLAFRYGCRNGFCGDCKGKVVAGEIAYPDGVPEILSPAEVSLGMALFCQARPACDITVEAREVSVAEDIPVRKLPCKVARLERACADVMRLFLRLPAGERLQFLAGQYLEIILKDGRRRAFSIANPPHDDEYLELHVRHLVGGVFTDYVFTEMHENALLRIEGPYGQFYLREASERPIIFMAGGTGFAPIKGIIEHAVAENLGRPMHLYWGARRRPDLYQHELAEQWAATVADFKYTPVLSALEPQEEWAGRQGFVHEAVAADYADLSSYAVYTAGPPEMVEAGRRAFTALGLPEDCFYSDAFTLAKDPA